MRSRARLLRYLYVVFFMGWSDFILKYRGSFFGYLWSLAGPLCRFLVILYVFGPYVGSHVHQYPLYLFLGVILWEHFVLTTTGCIKVLLEKAAIIRQIAFPRILLILAAGWTNMIIFFTHFLIFTLFALYYRVPLQMNQLYIFAIFLQMVLIALGIGMIVSAYSLRFRDIPHLWDVFCQILFWLTPIMYIYPVDKPLAEAFFALARDPERVFNFPGVFTTVMQFQPLSILIHDARRTLLYPELGVPTFERFLGFTAVALLIFVVGCVVFRRRSRFFLQEY